MHDDDVNTWVNYVASLVPASMSVRAKNVIPDRWIDIIRKDSKYCPDLREIVTAYDKETIGGVLTNREIISVALNAVSYMFELATTDDQIDRLQQEMQPLVLECEKVSRSMHFH
jgi:hypothetical protein